MGGLHSATYWPGLKWYRSYLLPTRQVDLRKRPKVGRRVGLAGIRAQTVLAETTSSGTRHQESCVSWRCTKDLLDPVGPEATPASSLDQKECGWMKNEGVILFLLRCLNSKSLFNFVLSLEMENREGTKGNTHLHPQSATGCPSAVSGQSSL